MMRPLYETEEDLDRERGAIMTLCGRTDAHPFKLPISAHADYIMMRDGEAKAVVEVKCRKNKRLAYDTYMLSQHKYEGLLSWAEYGLTPILLVSWQDAIGYVRLPCPHDIAVGGRRDRGDALDIEPVVHIKTSDFKVILDL